jgi:hypothetical protein
MNEIFGNKSLFEISKKNQKLAEVPINATVLAVYTCIGCLEFRLPLPGETPESVIECPRCKRNMQMKYFIEMADGG